MAKCKIINWFKEGQVINIQEVEFAEIIKKIKTEIEDLDKSF